MRSGQSSPHDCAPYYPYKDVLMLEKNHYLRGVCYLLCLGVISACGGEPDKGPQIETKHSTHFESGWRTAKL